MFTLLLLLAAQSTAPTPPVTKAAPPCADNRPRTVVGGERGARPHPLTAEPPARQIYTVLREEGGCSRPVRVNDQTIGTRPR